MTNPIYTCSQSELYTIARVGWNSCRQHLVDFADFKARYTDLYIDNRIAEMAAAQNLPDFQARNDASESQRVLLTELTRTILDQWQRLKRYIADAFPRSLQKTKLEAAGSTHYAKAANYNWDSVESLLVSATNFVNDNLATLTANENMPPNFQTKFNTYRTDFEAAHTTFIDSEETARIGRETKIVANNNVHRWLMNMFLDGQEIFKRQDAIKAQFVFDRVLQLASGSGSQGIKGYVTQSGSDIPIADVLITILQNGRTITTDSNGRYEMIQIANGTYNLSFEKTGYVTLLQEGQVVQVGTVGTLSVSLEAAP